MTFPDDIPPLSDLVVLALLWIGYFLIHSLIASLWAKQLLAHYCPKCLPWYRIFYNIQAILLILPPLILMWQLASQPLWHWEGLMAWVAYLLMLLACLGFLWSLRYYDTREFLGLRQLERHQMEIEDQEQLHISPLHRFVRHPWYSLGLILVWAQSMDPARLISALLITLYLIAGSRLEEQKLLALHGDLYRTYQKQVPGLIPRPWRYLAKNRLISKVKT
jgi:protein-S-isoprenylcysteine O-methyltransferase Ste14